MLPNALHKGNVFITLEKTITSCLIGCLFHFSQAVWRQVQNKGLSTKYKEDECFRLNVKKLIALAYVPLDDIITGYDLIVEQFDDDADDFLEYFEKTWIGERKRRGSFTFFKRLLINLLFLEAGRKKPLFDHKLWNIHDRVVTATPRSNNSVEVWHNSFANRVAIVHPNVVKLTEKIRSSIIFLKIWLLM